MSAPADGDVGRRRLGASITVPSRQRVLRSTAQPRAIASRSGASSAAWTRPLPVAATTMPAQPASTSARTRARVGAGAARDDGDPAATPTRRSAGDRGRAWPLRRPARAEASAAGLPRPARSVRRRPSRRRRGDTGGPCGRRAPSGRCRRRRRRRRARRAPSPPRPRRRGSAGRRRGARSPAASPPSGRPAWPARARAAGSTRSPRACRCRA